MDKINEDIDFGQWNVPESWNDINLGVYQDIERYYSEHKGDFKATEVLHILCDKSIDEVNALPITFVEKIMEHLTFLTEQPNIQPSNKIVIDGEEYVVHNEKTLKFGEYVSTDSIIRADSHNYAALLAVVCRKEGEEFDSKFEAEVYDERVKLFEKQPVINILPIIAFFLMCWEVTEGISQVYSMVKEEADQLVQSIKSSPNLGACKKRYLSWQAKRILKSLK